MATTARGIEAARELDELYRDHAPEIFRYAYAVLGNRADAEDVTQTTFVNALRALERGERPRTPKNWLITIAHNLIRQRFRQLQARPREVELDVELPAAETDDDGPSIEDLVRALQRIPPTQRQALVLRELEGRSYSEIGELLGRLPVRARDADLPRPPLPGRGAREPRHLRQRGARALAGHGRPAQPEGAPAPRSPTSTSARAARARRPAASSTGARSRRSRSCRCRFSLTLFKGAPSASAAVGLPTIGAAAGTSCRGRDRGRRDREGRGRARGRRDRGRRRLRGRADRERLAAGRTCGEGRPRPGDAERPACRRDARVTADDGGQSPARGLRSGRREAGAHEAEQRGDAVKGQERGRAGPGEEGDGGRSRQTRAEGQGRAREGGRRRRARRGRSRCRSPSWSGRPSRTGPPRPPSSRSRSPSAGEASGRDETDSARAGPKPPKPGAARGEQRAEPAARGFGATKPGKPG